MKLKEFKKWYWLLVILLGLMTLIFGSLAVGLFMYTELDMFLGVVVGTFGFITGLCFLFVLNEVEDVLFKDQQEINVYKEHIKNSWLKLQDNFEEVLKGN